MLVILNASESLLAKYIICSLLIKLLVRRIPLPKWVVEEIDRDPDLGYTDQWGRRNYEYVSLGCDTLPVLKGRTPVQCYSDFMRAFRDNFSHLLGDTVVVSIKHSLITLCLFESYAVSSISV